MEHLQGGCPQKDWPARLTEHHGYSAAGAIDPHRGLAYIVLYNPVVG
jgi:hypothetical protein